MKKTAFFLAALVAAAVLMAGCTTVKRTPATVQPAVVEPPALPEMPPVVDVEPEPVVFPEPIVAPIPQTPSSAQNVYVVKNGDSLSKIAVRHGIRQSEIVELNGIADPNKIRIGQKLILPDHAKPSLSPVSSSATAPAAPADVAANGEYVVKAGDALSKIAKAHGVKQADLMAANGIADANKIRIGQKLKIPAAGAAPAAPAKPAEPAPAPAAEAPAAPVAAPVPEAVPAEPAPVPEIAIPSLGSPAPIDYQVQDGDSVEALAGIFDVSPAAIRSLNNIPAGTEPRPGQSIRIPIR